MQKIHFAKATAPPKLHMPKLWWLPIALAALTGVMVLAQLATFEAFAEIIRSYGLVGDNFAPWFALLLTALEILSLPVLLRFRLSPAMRAVSAAAVFLVPLLWLQLTVWPLINGFALINAGYFGSFLAQPYGWWLILEALAYLGLSFLALRILGGDELLPERAGKKAPARKQKT